MFSEDISIVVMFSVYVPSIFRYILDRMISCLTDSLEISSVSSDKYLVEDTRHSHYYDLPFKECERKKPFLFLLTLTQLSTWSTFSDCGNTETRVACY